MSIVVETAAAVREQLAAQEKDGPGSVLVVDDSLVDARLAASILQKRMGLKVEFAGNGVQALASIARQMPLLVLTDLLMPEMDGMELVEEISQRYPHLPVVLMTSQGSADIAVQALQAGAASYVPKRVLQEQLPGAVQQVLALSQVDRRRQRYLEGITHLDYRLSMENDEALVPVFIRHVQEYLLRLGLCNENSRIRAGVALEEAMINGMHHGNLELSSSLKEAGKDDYLKMARERKSQSPYRERRLHIEFRMTLQEVRFVFRDEGPGFDVSKVPDPTDPENLLRPSGRGLLLIRMFMDEVFHNETGNQITLVRRRR